MPFIELETNVELEETKKEEIKSELGELIEIIPGKSETWLMVEVNDKKSLYFKGSQESALILKVMIYGDVSPKYFDTFTSKATSYLSNLLSIKKDRIYIAYFTTPNWGWNGNNF